MSDAVIGNTTIGSISVEDPYALSSLDGVATGACFMTFRNTTNTDDFLVGATAPDGAPYSMGMPMTFGIVSGTWTMIPLEPPNKRYFQIAPGVPTVLTPGYAHIMLMNLSKPLVAGELLSINLHFESGGASGLVTMPIN